MRDDVLIVCKDDGSNKQITDAWKRCLKATNPDIKYVLVSDDVDDITNRIITTSNEKYIIATSVLEWIKNRIDIDYLISQYDSDTLFISLTKDVNTSLLSPFFDGSLFFNRQVLIEYLNESDITNRRIRKKRIGDSTCWCDISDEMLKTGGNRRIRIESIIFSDKQIVTDEDIEWEFGG